MESGRQRAVVREEIRRLEEHLQRDQHAVPVPQQPRAERCRGLREAWGLTVYRSGFDGEQGAGLGA